MAWAERMRIEKDEHYSWIRRAQRASDPHYSSVESFLRRRFHFNLLKTCEIAMRRYKKPATTAVTIETLDLDLRTTASSC